MHAQTYYRGTMRGSWFSHDNEIMAKRRLSQYWPFVKGIHRLPVDSPHKGSISNVMNVKLWCFLWWESEQAVQQTAELPMTQSIDACEHHHSLMIYLIVAQWSYGTIELIWSTLVQVMACCLTASPEPVKRSLHGCLWCLSLDEGFANLDTKPSS